MQNNPLNRTHDELLSEGIKRAGNSSRNKILIDSTWSGSKHRSGFGVMPQSIRSDLGIDATRAKRDAASVLALAKAGALLNHAFNHFDELHHRLETRINDPA